MTLQAALTLTTRRQFSKRLAAATAGAGAAAVAVPAAASSMVSVLPVTADSPGTPDAQLIELGRRFVEISRIRDAASEEIVRLMAIGADEGAAEDAFEDAMDQLRAIFSRMISMRPTTIEGMRAVASAVFHFEWNGKVEYAEGGIEGAAVAVLVAGLLDKPLPDCLPDWAAAWI
ncbi:hypothetical protein [Bradyrhizobium sp. BWC-3-1]|uniref:hypothetical protein n=1 Tax=Bradyrhizobium sp. BWC-3-1 TaxID=3080012 RepID=UPI00293E3F4B|nr:hypothetical protein [Bradyrhizobium sp. BWC-3-1]WOH54898.1 hypothetical protein RX329_21440 [Bradyrhizobium sp. BWC-3-1]